MRFHWFVPLRPRRRWHRWLRWIGPTWAASPGRRVVQAVALALFLALFFWVCWPYTARPARVWNGWLPVEVDAQSGHATVAHDDRTAARPARGAVVHVVGEEAGGAKPLGAFSVVASTAGQLRLAPRAALSPEGLDALLMSFGPWSLREKPPQAWPAHYAEELAGKEFVPAELFLALDPLVSLSTALASRTWVWSLGLAGVMLGVSLLIPRGFCGYLCPLGTLIDLCDWGVNRRISRLRVRDDGWWCHLKYYLLAAIFVAALLGVLLAGFVAAIPVITRGLALIATPLQTGWHRGWHQMPPLGAGEAVSIALFGLVLALGLFSPRFWCKYVCPTGAVFSVGNLLRLNQRRVRPNCVHCNRCIEACPFDAIKPDFTTRVADCAFCQTCGGVCPTRAIVFVGRWDRVEEKAENQPPTAATRLGRRGFLATAAGLGGALGGAAVLSGTARTATGADKPPIRPPGSLPEPQFPAACIRCGECLQACPNSVLQPLGLEQGWNGLWTPQAVPDWSGCEASCNNCGQVCPTGAIRALPLAEKRVARMGLAVIDPATCLPHAGREACQLCLDECNGAGYRAIEFVRVGTELDAQGQPIDDSGFLAPVLRAELCVGCGLCQTRCLAINGTSKKLLRRSAIVVEAGPGKEDRIARGSYRALREAEQRERERQQRARIEASGGSDAYLPDFLK